MLNAEEIKERNNKKSPHKNLEEKRGILKPLYKSGRLLKSHMSRNIQQQKK